MKHKKKSIFCLILLTFLFSISRNGNLGINAQELTYIIYDKKIPFLDTEDININFSFFINNEPGIIGKTYFTNDNIKFKITPNKRKFYYIIIGKDSNGIFSLENNVFLVKKYSKPQPKELFTNSFILNSTLGSEVYYILYSNKKFEVSESVLESLKNIKLINKGINFSKTELKIELPKYLKQEILYFYHK